MLIMNFKSDSKAAFKHGFLKGLAAPVMLFGRFEMPDLEDVAPVKASPLSTDEPLSQDMKAVRDDFISVVNRS